jgi:phosphoesterase RecJ-like protein
MTNDSMLRAPQEIVDAMRSWERVVCVGHVTPDADCLAGMLGVATGFGQNGRGDVSLSLPPDSISQRLAFVIDEARPTLADAERFAGADGIVVCDTAKASRCNVDASIPGDWLETKPVINIDHHASNTQFGTINWVAPEASSTSEMVYVLLRAVGCPISPELCSLLYAGIITDTVGFTLGSTAPSTLRIAAELVSGGADVAAIGERLYRSMTDREFALLRIIHDNTRVIADGQLAYSTASHEEIRGTGCAAADIDEQVNVPRCLRGIRVALLITEGIRGKTRINFRGESGCRVLELAKAVGGGGHPFAAGAILDMSIDEALPFVLEKAEAYLAQGNG